jgi:hypothetical protein
MDQWERLKQDLLTREETLHRNWACVTAFPCYFRHFAIIAPDNIIARCMFAPFCNKQAIIHRWHGTGIVLDVGVSR